MSDWPMGDPAGERADEWGAPAARPTGSSSGQFNEPQDAWSDPSWTSGGTTVPAANSLAQLWLALAVAGFGLAMGIGLVVMAPRPTLVNALAAVVAWLLSGIVSVLAVSAYQARALRLAASAYFVPDPSARTLRLLPLVVGAVGVVVNSYYFANWLARAWDF